MGNLSHTNTFCVQKCCCKWVYYCLIRSFLFRIRTDKRFTNSSNYFEATVNTQSACEGTALTPAQRLRNWCERRPSNKVFFFHSSVKGGVWKILLHGNRPEFDFVLEQHYVTIIWLCFKLYNLYKTDWIMVSYISMFVVYILWENKLLIWLINLLFNQSVCQ
jgi:hypothetical protein